MSRSRPPSQNRLLDLEAELFGQRSPVASRQVGGQQQPQILQKLTITQSTPQFSYTQLADRLRGTTITSSAEISRLKSHTTTLAIEPIPSEHFELANLEPEADNPDLPTILEAEIIPLETEIINRPPTEEALDGLQPKPGLRREPSQPIAIWQPRDPAINIDRLRRFLLAVGPSAHLLSGQTLQPLLPSAQPAEPKTVQSIPESTPVSSQVDLNQNPDLTL